jgi:hypothetical protein
MLLMDAYFSDEALEHLRAQALELPRRRAGGLLLGHRRGGRFFVESVYPCPFDRFPSGRKYWALDGIFQGRIIGFYSSGRRAGAAARKWPPFACNKLYLEFDDHPKKGLILKPSVVEYADSFHLAPVALAGRPRRRK